MHAREMHESEGESTEWQHATLDRPDGTKDPWPCRICGGLEVYYRVWESHDGAYEDVNYHCRSCGRKWWCESDDG